MILTSIKHFSHHHILIKECNRTPYLCDGCKDHGRGVRYRCEDCNYDLHKECAFASSNISHFFYGNRTFKFLERAHGDRYCNACGEDVLGFVYHCEKSGYDLHPCCANLPRVLRDQGVAMILQKSLASNCWECGSKKLRGNVKGWSYKSINNGYHFHVLCLKKMYMKKWENGFIAEGEINNLAMEIVRPPALQQVPPSGRISKMKICWKVMKICWKIAKVLPKLIVSIISGDPVGGVIGLIGSLR